MLNKFKTNLKKKELLDILPQLTSTKYKGNNGKISIFGGSKEYTGAPYYSGISALYGVIYFYLFLGR